MLDCKQVQVLCDLILVGIHRLVTSIVDEICHSFYFFFPRKQ